MERLRQLSKREQEEAEKYGGAETDNYRKELLNYCNKGGHRERSMANDNGKHREHWKRHG